MKKLIILILIFSLCIVTFPQHRAEAATGINKKLLTLNLAETYTLKILGVSGKVSWKSENEKMATVSSKGLIEPVSPGVVVITGTINKSSFLCTVTITASDKDYLAYEDDLVKVIFKGIVYRSLCFEFVNKTDNYYYIKTKAFDVDGTIYNYYLYDSTFKGKSVGFNNYKPSVNAKDKPGITNKDIKNISGMFVLCWVDGKEEIEKIEFSIDIE